MDNAQQPTQARQAAHSSKVASGRRIKAPSQTKASGRQMDDAQQPTQARQAAHSSKVASGRPRLRHNVNDNLDLRFTSGIAMVFGMQYKHKSSCAVLCLDVPCAL